ncbi:hypothetical protein cypCar_00021637 [Cyprinus carpio]|nr:hypothetical protein cypCar_00021637 [Cyprinus carpio]
MTDHLEIFCIDNNGVKKMKVQFATGPLLKFQIWHIASFLSMFKLLLIGVIIVGKDPFALFGMQAPGSPSRSDVNQGGSPYRLAASYSPECQGTMPVGQEVGVGGVKLPKAHRFNTELKALKANKRAHVPESTSSLETLPYSATSSFLHAINIFSGKE